MKPLELELNRLVRARARVERGWCQNKLMDERGNVCLEGSLHNVTGQADAVSASLVRRLHREIEARGESAVFDGHRQRMMWSDESKVWPWNDHPKRTKAEVLSLMDAAIVNLGTALAEFVPSSPPPAFWEMLARTYDVCESSWSSDASDIVLDSSALDEAVLVS